MSFYSFVQLSLKNVYSELPTIGVKSGVVAGVSYLTNKYASRFVTFSSPETAAKFSAAAYLSWEVFKAFRTETDQEMHKWEQTNDFHENELSSQHNGTKKPASPSSELASKATSILLGAYIINAKVNPESTFSSFAKLSVATATVHIIQKFLGKSHNKKAFKSLSNIYETLPQTAFAAGATWLLSRSVTRLGLDPKTTAIFTAVASIIWYGSRPFFEKLKPTIGLPIYLGCIWGAKEMLSLDLPHYKQLGKASGVALATIAAINFVLELARDDD